MKSALLLVASIGLFACGWTGKRSVVSTQTIPPLSTVDSRTQKNSVPVIHVFVALCDNVNQGIVPVAPSLGNGDDPSRNLYWGAAFGVKTFFSKNKSWLFVRALSGAKNSQILERAVFKHAERDVFMVADAYRGSEIKRATQDFLDAAAGIPGEAVDISYDGKKMALQFGGGAQLITYIGHDGLMDFQPTSVSHKHDEEKRDAIILACASKNYFADALRPTGARPLLWTTNLMAPEAYVLSAAIDGWLNKETDEQIRLRVAKAYNRYQNCGLQSANKLFATGW